MKIIFKTWYKPLLDILNSKYFSTLIKSLNIQYDLSKFKFNKVEIYPKKNEVFKCFKCDFTKLKLVIIGNNPFGNFSGGLAFDTNDYKLRLHPFTELLRYKIEHTFYDGFKLDFDNSLEYLMEQGVLLLNESLTYQNNKDTKEQWVEFIEFVIKTIQKHHTGIIFYVQKDSKLIKLINNDLHYILEYDNPEDFINSPNKWNLDLQQVNGIIKDNNGDEYIIKF